MQTQTIEISRPSLPAVLPNEQQKLMDLFYGHWQDLAGQAREKSTEEAPLRSPLQEEIAAVMPAKVNAAVILGNHSYQVCNGGWMQWDDNGYSRSAEALRNLYFGAAAVGIADADKVLALVEEFIQHKADGNRTAGGRVIFSIDEDGDDQIDNYQNLDERYYAIEGEVLMQTILDRFDEVLAGTFMLGAYKKAA